MQFARQTLYEVITEAQPLLERHYEELCLSKDIAKLNPRWDVYAELERLDAFVVFTARDEGKLEGYSAFFLNKSMHYADLTVALNDVFWIEEAHRASVPLRFIRYCEDELKARGVDKLVFHAKTTNNLAPLLQRMGYAIEEVMCAKLLRAA